jgi:ribosome maturation factor RimP
LFAGSSLGRRCRVEVGERVRRLVEPVLAQQGVELVDVDQAGGTLRVTVDRPGGIDLDALTEVTRTVSDLLDRHDPVPGRYTLEVSSPGVERPLRTPEHFRRFVGSSVAVRTVPGAEGERRVEGTLTAADDEGVVVDGRRLAYADIERARTRFEWGPPPRPARPSRKKSQGARTP